jgi:outer membrane protein assembly factor BamB
MFSVRISRRFAFVLSLVLMPATLSASDWPTYRGNNSRTGATEESISSSLHLQWQYDSPAPMEMAWSSAEGRVLEGKLLGNRVKFDDAIHPVIVGNKVYFGSSVDDQLHCFDLKTGQTNWTFFTGAPIRLAPTVTDGRVYFGSDDGHVYCLQAHSGELVWQFRAGPEEDWLLARGKLISRWPVRSSVLVQDGIAYFGAGIFPHENVQMYAVNAADGAVIWKQDDVSTRDAGRDDLSPQGYFLASDDLLFVPSGRSLPAAVDRETGKIVHKRSFSWRTTAGGVVGGAQALLANGQIYSNGPHHLLAMDQKTGDVGFGWFAGRQMVVTGDDAFVATGTVVARLDHMEYAINSRLRHKLEMEVYDLTRKLRKPGDKEAEYREKLAAANAELLRIADIGVTWQKETSADKALLATADLAILGGHNSVTAHSRESGETVWSAEVDGSARGLAAANGHLFVSTDEGKIYCFGSAESATEKHGANVTLVENPFPEDQLTAIYQQAAADILKTSGVNSGFCLVVDGEEGRLAFELAKRSQLRIYVVEPNAEKVKTARAALAKTDMYGSRITIHQFDANAIPYANYFANLIVSDSFVKKGELGANPSGISRHLKPLGGVLALGSPQSDDAAQALTQVNATVGEDRRTADEAPMATHNGWAPLTRGALPGAGSWSHQYGNPGNTAVSDDQRINGGLGVLWYGDPGPGEMVNRHDGAVGPLATNGRLFVQGETTIRAYDAYNGQFLWNYDNPKGIRIGVFQNVSPGNLAASDDRLFHFIDHECFELDAATGEQLRVHRLPKEADDGKHEWAYLVVQGDLLFGTATVMDNIDSRERRRGRRTKDATDAIFAIDLKTGEHLWTYQGQSISHRTIAVGPKHVYFIDSSVTSVERAIILAKDKSGLEFLTGKERELAEDRLKKADIRSAVAIDSRTGEKTWEKPVDVTDCSDIGIGGGMLTLMYQNDMLILCGANANGHYWKQFVAGEFSRRRLVGLRANDGYKLWSKDANYRNRPIIVGDKVLAEPWMYNLETGEQLTRSHPLTNEQVPWSMMRTGHHCGMLTGSESGMIMFRSGFTGFMDLNQDAGVRHFAGHRLGCWINAIPANGLVMIPEASVGCVCQFSIASTVVLEPREERRPWAIYSSVGAKTPVKHMAINLGAPGDRKDAYGTVWLSYPRYKAYQETSLDIKLDLQPTFADDGGFRSVNESSTQLGDTQTPWLYSSLAEGITKLTLPLLGEGDAPAIYTVKLHFADTRKTDKTPSTFSVALNGEQVAGELALNQPDQSNNVIVHEVNNVQITDSLTIELTGQQGTTLLNAIEVVRAD